MSPTLLEKARKNRDKDADQLAEHLDLACAYLNKQVSGREVASVIRTKSRNPESVAHHWVGAVLMRAYRAGLVVRS